MLSESRIPKRLSDETHVLASRAQNGEWGRSLAELDVTLDNYDGLRNMSDEMRYVKCIELIAEHAPLRIVSGELVVGSATSFSPSPGSDRQVPTAVIKSHCSMGLEKLTNGTALELKIFPGSVDGESGLNALIALIRSFIQLGGIFMHVDVVDNKTLLDAQTRPERYQNLAVRVSGWSARFVTLDKEWQNMIINRTVQR